MEFTSLEVTKTSVLLQLKHPSSGEPLWHREPEFAEDGTLLVEGDPVGVYIFSTDSEPYQKRKKALLIGYCTWQSPGSNRFTFSGFLT